MQPFREYRADRVIAYSNEACSNCSIYRAVFLPVPHSTCHAPQGFESRLLRMNFLRCCSITCMYGKGSDFT